MIRIFRKDNFSWGNNFGGHFCHGNNLTWDKIDFPNSYHTCRIVYPGLCRRLKGGLGNTYNVTQWDTNGDVGNLPPNKKRNALNKFSIIASYRKLIKGISFLVATWLKRANAGSLVTVAVTITADNTHESYFVTVKRMIGKQIQCHP